MYRNDYDREKTRAVEDLVSQAELLMAKAAEMSLDEDVGPVYTDGPAYGMGGTLKNGEWMASSQSC